MEWTKEKREQVAQLMRVEWTKEKREQVAQLMRALSDDEVKDAVAFYNSHPEYSMEDLAKKLGIGRRTLHRHIRRVYPTFEAKNRVKAGRRCKLSTEDVAYAVAQYELHGASVRVLAAELGVGYRTLYRAIDRFNASNKSTN